MAGFIPQDKYKEILDLIAIPCVDIAVRHKGKLLLIKRQNPPLQGAWWLPGGRIFKHETMEQAARRKLKEETNLEEVKILKRVGPYETMFDDAPFGIKTGVHSINVAFLMEVDDISTLKSDKNHTGSKWVDKMDKNWHPYLKQVLEDCNFFAQKD
jgi:colanic acid biosynthesis protein WcaH